MSVRSDRIIFTIAAPFILLGYCAALVGQAVRDFPKSFRDQWDALEGDHTNVQNPDDLY